MRLHLAVTFAVCALSAACKKEAQSPPAAPPGRQEAAKPVPPAPADAAKPPAEVAASAEAAAKPGRSDPECVGPIDLAVPAKLAFGNRKAEINGFRLVFEDRDSDDQAVLGVLANLNEDSGENLFNLKRYLDFFKKERVEAIVVAGDTGESTESIERALTPLAETGLPVFVVVGNRECKGDFNDAILRLQKARPNVINMNRVRYVDFDDVALASMPGYHDGRYLHCATGCQYFKQDVEALQAFLVKRAGDKNASPMVLVSHGPPRGETPGAIDRTEGGNVGDTAIGALLKAAQVPFGIFANIKEAGARATDLAGTNLVREDTFADALYLNPGAADSFPWNMNDGTTSNGVAATLTVKGKQAKYRLYRAKPLTAAEKAQAAKLAPSRGAGGEGEGSTVEEGPKGETPKGE